ncbi:MAG: hypothetical protein AAGD88_18185 [Bacteroidota bacterium]
MKNSLKSLFLMAIASVVLIGCSDDDNGGGNGATVTNVSDATATEGEMVTHTVNLSNTVGGSFSASLDGGTASADDFDDNLANASLGSGVTFSNGEITVPQGVGSFTVEIETLVDDLDEDNESYTLTVGDQTGTGTISDDDLPAAFIIQSTVQSQAGDRTVFLNVFSDFPDEVDISEAIEFNSNSRFQVYDGKVYVFDSENVEVIRFGVDENNELIEEDKFSMAGLGVSGFGTANAIVSDQHAVSGVQGVRQLVFWNPTTMEITGTVDYPDIIPQAFRGGFTASIDGDGRVFFAYSGFDFSTFSNQPGARVLIVDPVAQTLEPLFDEDVAAGTDGDVDANGDFYLNADAYLGLGRYLVPVNRDTIQTVQRINRGETTFDPTFNLLTSDITPEGYPQTAAFGFRISGDQFASIFLAGTEQEIAADPQGALLQASIPRVLFAGSTTDWEGSAIEFNDASKALATLFVVDGEFYVVATNPLGGGSTDFNNDLYRLTTSNTLERVTSTVGFFENMAKIR